MAKANDLVRVVGWYVVLLAAITAGASIYAAVTGDWKALGGLIWAVVIALTGLSMHRRHERDRQMLLGVLWLYAAVSLIVSGLAFKEHLQTSNPAALTRMLVGLGWCVLAGWPLLILHRPSIRQQFVDPD